MNPKDLNFILKNKNRLRNFFLEVISLISFLLFFLFLGKGEVPEYDTTRTIKTPNNFALFVKENYHSVKSTRTNAKHAEIMKILSQQYAIVKNAGKPQPLPAETK